MKYIFVPYYVIIWSTEKANAHVELVLWTSTDHTERSLFNQAENLEEVIGVPPLDSPFLEL